MPFALNSIVGANLTGARRFMQLAQFHQFSS
jgi:hypothetical protein